MSRPHRPPSPGSVPPPDESKTGKPGKKDDKKKDQPPPEPEPEIELDENGGKARWRISVCARVSVCVPITIICI